jgi:hypothetical protein
MAAMVVIRYADPQLTGKQQSEQRLTPMKLDLYFATQIITEKPVLSLQMRNRAATAQSCVYQPSANIA